MNFMRFFRWAILLFVGFGILFFFLSEWFPLPNIKTAIWTGLLISFGNALAGFAFISIGMRRRESQFMILVFGGMFFRILLIFSLLFVLIRAFNFNESALLLSMVVTYFSFMILEIVLIHQYSKETGN